MRTSAPTWFVVVRGSRRLQPSRGLIDLIAAKRMPPMREFQLVLQINMCKNTHMSTNLALDDRLIEEARRVGRHKTKREAVSAALAEYVKRRKQLRILDAFGTIDFDPKYDYKTERRRKHS